MKKMKSPIKIPNCILPHELPSIDTVIILFDNIIKRITMNKIAMEHANELFCQSAKTV